ncbi:hypothetical protein Cni_G19631 [Canna indica]|uniref:Uncharacterized protein n=1 Tax=Canna indica TaxID=4628 RepID=A0AAQ3KKY0_9LILI|nr:hypothetical protein Cni_G19631 [Canna indica]
MVVSTGNKKEKSVLMLMENKIVNASETLLDESETYIYVRCSPFRDFLSKMKLAAGEETEGGYVANVLFVGFGFQTTSNMK